MKAKKVKAVLKYPGAKWALMDWINRFVPRCRRVVDLYCGSGAFASSLGYRPDHLVINDVDRDINNLFRTIREREAELARAVALTLWSRAEYLEILGPQGEIVRTGEPLEDARRFLVRTWQAHATQTYSRSGWRHKGATVYKEADTYELWAQLPDRIAVIAQRLREAEIEALPALTLIGRYATPDTLLYADPPYVRVSTHGQRRKLYRHEMDQADHEQLLDALSAHPGPVLLSGYRSDLYDERLASWRRVEREAQAEKAQRRVECLWLNPVCVERLGHGPMFEEAT